MLINEFNKTIMNLKNIDVIIDHKNQVIIMICSLSFYEYVVGVMVYGRDTLQ